MVRRNCLFVLPVFLIALTTSLDAQPGRGGRGGPPGRGGFDPTEMLRRMDTNNNGMLDPDEVSDRAKGFISRMTEGRGVDMNRPISIDRLRGIMDERRRERRLIADYEALVTELLDKLDADNHALAVELAAIPEKIRGFGHVKEASIETAKACEAELLEAFRHPERRRDAAE